MPSIKKIITFDLDGTLTESRTRMDEEMAGLFSKLISQYKIGVISGGLFGQFEKQIVQPLSGTPNLSNLILLPANGTSFYVWENGSWKILYEKSLSDEEKQKIVKACMEAIKETGWKNFFIEKKGEVTDKKGQMTLGMFDPDWPIEEKKAWDPDREKRESIRELIQGKLPEYEVKIGGTTSIDVTPKGLDKAFAIKKILEYFHLSKESALFIGDAIFEGGNDYPASQVVESVSVSNPQDTKKIIRSLVG